MIVDGKKFTVFSKFKNDEEIGGMSYRLKGPRNGGFWLIVRSNGKAKILKDDGKWEKVSTWSEF